MIYGAIATVAALGMGSVMAWPGIADASHFRETSSGLAFHPGAEYALDLDTVNVSSAVPHVLPVALAGFSAYAPEPGDVQLAVFGENGSGQAVNVETNDTDPHILRSPSVQAAGTRSQKLPAALLLEHPVTTRRISSPYGWRANPTGFGHQVHIGQDYPIACGSPVYASEAGVVTVSGWAGHSGYRVTISHGSNVLTGYSHNSSLLVSSTLR